MRLLAIDSSINNIGWAILDSDQDIDSGKGLLGSGTMRTKIKTDEGRVKEINDLLNALIKWNNQDFPPDTPTLDIDPTENADTLQGQAFREQRRIGLAIIEKPEGFTYDRHVSRSTGKSMTKQALGQNNFAVGIIAASLLGRVDRIEFVSAQQWKGKQQKSVTQLIVNNQFHLKLQAKNNDESDAIGIGCWKIRRLKTEERIRRADRVAE